MRFEQHAFISYAHVDNLTTPDDERGWITRFQQQLTAYLSTEIADRARLWRDDRLRGDQVFGDEIVAQFPKTALLIAVVSPRYLESDWCLREVREFCAAAERNGGLVVDRKTRVVRVLLKPIAPEQLERLPAELRAGESLGYPFFEEVEGRRTLRLDPALGNGEAYRRNVMFLAEDLAETIRGLDAAVATPVAAPLATPVSAAAAAPTVAAADAPPGLTVYLAECGADRREDRERLRAELKAHGVRVLPESRLPELQSEYVAEVDRLLAECRLSLHPIGSSYGAVPDGPGLKSGAMLQNECAVRRARSDGLMRLIWLPEDTQPEIEPQARFIAELQSSPELQTGADLVNGSLERFKMAMHAALKALSQPPQPEAPAADGPPTVYLLCDARDRKATLGLRKWLRDKGIEVSLPAFEGDAAEVREANRRSIATCTAVVVFYGVGGEAWKRTTDNELKKQLGLLFGRAAPQVWTYLAEPRSGDKDDLIDMEEERLVDGLDGLDEARLRPLLGALAAGRVAA